MEIKITTQNNVTLVSVSGSIDALTAETLLNTLVEQVSGGVLHLIADLSSVNYTSSAGLRAILAAQKEIRQHGGDLRLAGVQPVVLKVLKLSGFTNIFKMYDNTAAALESFSRA